MTLLTKIATVADFCQIHTMSSVAEIEAALAQLPPAQFREIRRWMDAQTPSPKSGTTPPQASKTLDFLARQKAIFGDRIVPDSQPIFDELRADRF